MDRARIQEVNRQHDEAMEIADQADSARRRGNTVGATQMYLQAANIEKRVAESLGLPDPSAEPSRSVMWRSAAALYFSAANYADALACACAGISQFTPGEILEELNQIAQDSSEKLT